MIRVSEGTPAPHRLVLPLAGREAERAREASLYDDLRAGWTPLHLLAEEAARTAEVPMSAINLLKMSMERTVATVGGEATAHSREDSLCGPIIGARRSVHVEDVSRDARWVGNPFVDGRWASVRFYGAHPLVSRSGLVIGTLCVLDDRPRTVHPSTILELDALATRVVNVLEQWRAAALTP